MRRYAFPWVCLALAAAACSSPAATPTAPPPATITPAVATATVAATRPAAPPSPTQPAPSATPAPSVTVAAATAPPETDGPPHVETVIESQTGTAYGIAFSPDGQFLSVASGAELTLLTADLQTTVTVFHPEGDIPLLTAAWRPDGLQFATVAGLRDHVIHLWDWDAAAGAVSLAQDLDGGADQFGLSFSPDGQRLIALAADRRSTLQLWDTATWTQGERFQLPYLIPRRALDWSPDSARVYDAGEKGGQMVIFSLDVRDGTVTEYPQITADEHLQALAVSPDEQLIALADDAGAVRLLDLATGAARWVLAGPAEIDDLAWSPDGGRLAVLTYRRTVQVWDLAAAP